MAKARTAISSHCETETLRLWRRYTIRVREADSTVLEEVEIRFVGPDEIRWTSHETIADDPRRFQRDVTLTRRR